MAKKQDVFTVGGIDTAIGSTVKLRGNLHSDGDVAIDGTLVGNIRSGGHVAIGMNGQVQGNIEASSVMTAGRIEGNIAALDSISLLASGQVYGDIKTGRLEIAMGAIFIGTSKMKPAEASELKAPIEAASKK